MHVIAHLLCSFLGVGPLPLVLKIIDGNLAFFSLTVGLEHQSCFKVGVVSFRILWKG